MEGEGNKKVEEKVFLDDWKFGGTKEVNEALGKVQVCKMAGEKGRMGSRGRSDRGGQLIQNQGHNPPLTRLLHSRLYR